jgi:hypothetical protein
MLPPFGRLPRAEIQQPLRDRYYSDLAKAGLK